MAATLAELGIQRAFVVHGADGLDEISLSGETYVAEVNEGTVKALHPHARGFRHVACSHRNPARRQRAGKRHAHPRSVRRPARPTTRYCRHERRRRSGNLRDRRQFSRRRSIGRQTPSLRAWRKKNWPHWWPSQINSSSTSNDSCCETSRHRGKFEKSTARRTHRHLRLQHFRAKNSPASRTPTQTESRPSRPGSPRLPHEQRRPHHPRTLRISRHPQHRQRHRKHSEKCRSISLHARSPRHRNALTFHLRPWPGRLRKIGRAQRPPYADFLRAL